MAGSAGLELTEVLAAVLGTSEAAGDAALTENWDALYPLWSRYLFMVGARLGLRPEAMKDALQDVLHRILRGWEKYRKRGAQGLLTLSWKAMRNRLMDALRHRKRWHFAPLEAFPEERMSSGAAEDACPVERGERWEWLYAGLVELKRQQPENCKLLCLYYFQHRSCEELATQEGLSLNAVKGRLKRARLGLRVLMAEHPLDGETLP